jgi:hypothetical protein
MLYPLPRSRGKSFLSIHLRCSRAADDLAEEKPHIIQLEEHESPEIAVAQVKVYLCTKYSFSANNAGALVEQSLQVSIPQKREFNSCKTGRS